MLYASGISTKAINCVPVADGWGPHPGLNPVSLPLGSIVAGDGISLPCFGAVAVRTSTGGFRIFAGSQAKLYEYNGATLGWVDVSRSGDPYGVPSTDKWWFQIFGARLMAGNLNDEPQFIDIDAGADFADLAGSPPNARYAWVAGSQLVLGHLAGFPNRVMTSGLGDVTFWETGRRGCDFQDFPDGEEVMGGRGSQGGALVAQKRMFRSMTMQSGDVAFRTDVLNADRGVIAPLSLAWIGPGQFVYLSADGFFKGVEGTPIGIERVDRWFLSEINRARIGEVRAFVDPNMKIVWWQAPRVSGALFRIGYHWPSNRWCYSDLPFTEMATLVTPGISIAGLTGYFGAIEDIILPMDSPLLTGGIPALSVFDSSNRLCYLTGGALAATLDVPDTQLTPGARSWLSKARMVTDSMAYTLRVNTSDFHGGNRTLGTAVAPYAATGICHFRSSALMHAFRAEIAENTTWSHATGIDFPAGGFRQEGQR